MARRSQDFQTIRSEGGLLPADLLRRILDPREKMPGTTPEEYGLPHGERINETITQSWNRLRRHWAEFSEAARRLPGGEAATGLTNDRWSIPLLRELGFGILPTSVGPEIGGRTYAINRFFGPVAIHLVGCGLSLDRRTAGARGAASANPHGLVQDYLNWAEGYLLGIVSNGLQFRILRDNQALSRQSYLEFDLEAMFSGEVFPDFVLLWLVAHATRFTVRDGGRAENCWLEEWTKLAEEQGARALESLKGGVEKALEVLGQGFVGHPRNVSLRESLRSGTVSLTDLHSQLLRVVYRLIFLFVAEDRTLEGISLIHPPDESDRGRQGRERYAVHYSTARLRDLASRIRGSRHGDLWHQFNLLVGALSGKERFAAVREHLSLPSLGSFLWLPDSTGDLDAPSLAGKDGAELSNADLLEAIRHLAFTRQGRILRPVDYRNLGSEELGGVYESLLALTPQISGDGSRFTFAELAGNERKTSGSYYTPDSLVQCLLDSALDPVVEEAIKDKSGIDAEKALLSLKVCDPAVGSGHFLVGAAHRLASHLARIRAVAHGESEPSPPVYQSALRDVIGHCLYGVDVSPMAAELCKVSLWLDALEPGKPLSFLDHHIRVGNSLLGAAPDFIVKGIPDEAFKPIEGDDKKACGELRKRNKSERKGLGPLFARHEEEIQTKLATVAAALEELPDNRPEEIHQKESKFGEYERTEEYAHKKLLADTWCSAFVIRRHLREANRVNSASGITQGHLNDLANDRPLPTEIYSEVEQLSAQYRFFHWHLAFPEVFAKGGFDCVFGNPPWERVKLQEKEWFAQRSPGIASAPNAAARKRMIEDLKASDPSLHRQFLDDSREAEGESHLLRNSGRYPLCGRGDINVYTVFAEGMRSLLNERGRAGCVLPSGIATDDTTKFFFQDVMETRSLVSLFDFENKGIFSGVHSSYKFCLFTVGNGVRQAAGTAEFVFFAHSVDDLNDPERRFTLSAEDISLLNPNTRTCPIFRSSRDAELTKAIYRRVPVLIREAQGGRPEENPWGITFSRMFDMSNDSHFFRTREQMEAEGWQLEGSIFRKDREEYLPLYEAKMIHHFDHRWATYTLSDETRDTLVSEKAQPSFVCLPRYWVEKREVILRAAVLPKGLIQALRENDQQLIILALTHMLFGRWLIAEGFSPQGAATEGLFPAWSRFVDSYPFARSIAPTRLGLCGDNEACLQPVNSDCFPASPIDEIENGEVRHTTWYAVDKRVFHAFLETMRDYPIEIDRSMELVNEKDALAFAEACLEAMTPKWFLGFRDICRSTDERTVIGGVFPMAAVGNNLPIWFIRNKESSIFAAILASFALDCPSRFKVGGTHLNFFIAEQIPVLRPALFSGPCPWASCTLQKWLLRLILELTYTAWDLKSFADDCGYYGPPFVWNEKRRFFIGCELDAAFLHLYLGSENEWSEQPGSLLKVFPTPRHAVDYIMETFPIVKRKDEAAYGIYLTKETILEIYDALAESIRTGRPYQTRLDPPPGPPVDGQGNFLPLPEWQPGQPRPANWPSHIHPPKEAVVKIITDIPLEEFAAAMVYPITDTDKTICAAALSIVEQSPGLSSNLHLDILLLTAHPDWCRVLLDQGRWVEFDMVRKSVASALFVADNQVLGWRHYRDYLEEHGAIVISRIDKEQRISLGRNAEFIKTVLPKGTDAVVGYAVEAARRVVEMRQGILLASPTQKKIIDAMGDEHRVYQLAG
jgi:hypothetical protein